MGTHSILAFVCVRAMQGFVHGNSRMYGQLAVCHAQMCGVTYTVDAHTSCRQNIGIQNGTNGVTQNSNHNTEDMTLAKWKRKGSWLRSCHGHLTIPHGS